MRTRTGGGRRLRAAVATGAMVAMAMPGLSADGAVGAGRSIEVFTASDLVMLAGYPPSTRVRVEVLRHGFVVGYTTRSTDSLGGIEINHAGGLAGDCFDSPTSPDIQPSDTIRATVLGASGAPDTSVVRGVSIADVEFGATTITVSGQVELTGPAAVDPAADVLELRINKDTDWDGTGSSDLRALVGGSVDPLTGAWEHVLTVSESDATEAALESETVLEWSNTSASELTIAEAGEPEPLEGCPPPPSDPTAPQLLEAQDSGRVGDHVTNQATGLTFSGLAGTGVLGDDTGPHDPVALWVDGVPVAEGTANAVGVYEFTGITLTARPTPHTVRVFSSLGHASRLVTVDTGAPRVGVRRFAPDPLSLTGREQLRAVYNVREAASLQARIVHVGSGSTVRSYLGRTVKAGLTEYTWNGKNQAGRDVDPGRYQLVLELTDRAGNVTVQRDGVRVTR